MGEKIKSGATITIHSEMDVLRARQVAVKMARSLKFPDIALAEIEIAVSELGTNIVKHANSQGVLSITPCRDPLQDCQGLKLTARNAAPCRDPAALEISGLMRAGGGSTTGSLGIGVSGVQRLMDEFSVETDAQGCLSVSAAKWLVRSRWARANCSVMARPCVGESHSGDAYYVRHMRQSLLFGVIDGLGHGPEAHAAASTAVKTIDLYQQEPLAQIVQKCHKALYGSRGAAMALGLLDYASRRIMHVSIGNVETRLWGGDKISRLVCYNGTLGVVLPDFQVLPYPFFQGMLLVMYSDGISDKFELAPTLRRDSPQKISQYIFSNFSRSHDDNTVLVIK